MKFPITPSGARRGSGPFEQISSHEVISGFNQLEPMPKEEMSSPPPEEDPGDAATQKEEEEEEDVKSDEEDQYEQGAAAAGTPLGKGSRRNVPSSTRSNPLPRGFHELEPIPIEEGGFMPWPKKPPQIDDELTSTYPQPSSRSVGGGWKSVSSASSVLKSFFTKSSNEAAVVGGGGGPIGELPAARLSALKRMEEQRRGSVDSTYYDHRDRAHSGVEDEGTEETPATGNLLGSTQDSDYLKVTPQRMQKRAMAATGELGYDRQDYESPKSRELREEGLAELSPLNTRILNPHGDDSGSEEEEEEELGTYVADWSRRPGETSASHAARLYLSNLDSTSPHEVNCERLLRQILEYVAFNQLHPAPSLKIKHLIKIETFLRTTALSLPARTWRQNVQRIISPRGMSSQPRPGEVQPQMSEDELVFRLDYFVRSFQEMRKVEGDDSILDPYRVEALMRGYLSTAAEVLPLARPAHSLLPSLLNCIACDVLLVRILCQDVHTAVENVIKNYERRSKMMLSATQNAEKFLRPLVGEFLAWLRENQEPLQHACATEALLRCVDTELRSHLRNQVYTSPEHFLSIFQSISHKLMGIELPANSTALADVSGFNEAQTTKDVSREQFVVNGEMVQAQSVFAVLTDLMVRCQPGSFHPNGEGEKQYLADCVWRVLHAACRTESGGDAFFILQDLFGGEGVVIKAARQGAPPITISNRGLSLKVCMFQVGFIPCTPGSVVYLPHQPWVGEEEVFAIFAHTLSFPLLLNAGL
jgi:hypothetical protein